MKNISIELKFFRYPSTFIATESGKHFLGHMPESPFLTLVENETQFRLMRQRLLGEPTPRQSQASNSAATADSGNDQTDDILNHTTASTKLDKNPTTNKKAKLFIHYTHERRFQSNKRDLHRVYEETFQSTPAMNATFVVGNRNRRDAKHELIRKRPSRALLQDRNKTTAPSNTQQNNTIISRKQKQT